MSLNIVLKSFIDEKRGNLRGEDGGIYDAVIVGKYKNRNQFEVTTNRHYIKEKSESFSIGKTSVGDGKYEIELIAYDEKKCSTMLNVDIKQGRAPNKDHEIALEQWIARAINPNLKIGDKIKLPIVSKNYKNKEKLNEFTVVGFFKYDHTNKENKRVGKAYINKNFVLREYPKELITIIEHIKYKEDFPIDRSVSLTNFDLIEDMTLSINNNRYMFYKGVSSLNDISTILNIVILIISTILIYNVFLSSITERTKELGILRALGLTPKETKALVMGEGLILAIIFVPISMFLGGFICRLLMTLVTKDNYMIDFLNMPRQGMKASIIVGFASVILGSNSAAKKASKISPVEAMKNLDKQDFNERIIKEISSNMENESKGFIFSMAKINLKRNRKKFISTVTSMSMSVVLFTVISFIIISMNPIEEFKKNFGGDFILEAFNYKEGIYIKEKHIKNVQDIEGIKNIKKEKILNTNAIVTMDLCTSEAIDKMKINMRKDKVLQNIFNENKCSFPVQISGYDDKQIKDLEPYVKEGKIDITNLKYKNIIVIQGINDKKPDTKFKTGDSVEIKTMAYDENKNVLNSNIVEFKIEAIIKTNKIPVRNNETSCLFIMSPEAMEEYLGLKDYQSLKIDLDKDAKYSQVEKQLNNIANSNQGFNLHSYKKELALLKKKTVTFSLIMYTFIFMVALISIVNIFNTMSMNVLLRKKEFGMLRAIGISKVEIIQMLVREGMFYGIWTSVFGLVLSIVISYFLFEATGKAIISVNFAKLILVRMIPVCLIVIVLAFIAALNASRKAFSDSIIESMRGIE